MVLANLGAWIMRRLGDAMLGYTIVCVTACCFGFCVYLSSLFCRDAIGYHGDVKCGVSVHFKIQTNFYECFVYS